MIAETWTDEDRALIESLAAEAEADYESEVAYSSVEAVAIQREVAWPALRREVMRRGGLGRGPYSKAEIPAGLFRLHGAAPDDLAAELGHDSADSMLAFLQRAWATWRAKFPPRPSKPRARRVDAVPLLRISKPAATVRPQITPWSPSGWRVLAGCLVRMDADGRIVQAVSLDGQRWRSDVMPTMAAKRTRRWRYPAAPILELDTIRQRRDLFRLALATPTLPTPEPRPASWWDRLRAWALRRHQP